MFSQAIKAEFSALKLLVKSRRTLILIAALYGGLLFAGYLFVSTREATIAQLIVTLAVIIVAPPMFFALQAVSLTYAHGSRASFKKLIFDSLKLIPVSIVVIFLTLLAFKGLGRIHSHLTIVNAMRYLLVAVIAPLLTIQLWIAVSREGLRQLLRRSHRITANAFAPQSVFIYGCGLLCFAVVPYLLLFHATQIERPWLEVSLLVVRLIASALLILIGWVTTIGSLSIVAGQQTCESVS